jgi:c-di-GMP-binding flagellar brake protein YcgR
MEDKRQYIRWNVSLPAKYKIDGQEKECFCQIKDMGNGGICISCMDKIDPNQVLHITINMPQEVGSVNATGRAVWQRESQDVQEEGKGFPTGIKFITLSYADRDRIFNYILRFKRQELVRRWWAQT